MPPSCGPKPPVPTTTIVARLKESHANVMPGIGFVLRGGGGCRTAISIENESSRHRTHGYDWVWDHEYDCMSLYYCHFLTSCASHGTLLCICAVRPHVHHQTHQSATVPDITYCVWWPQIWRWNLQLKYCFRRTNFVAIRPATLHLILDTATQIVCLGLMKVDEKGMCQAIKCSIPDNNHQPHRLAFIPSLKYNRPYCTSSRLFDCPSTKKRGTVQ